ncbi:MAG: cell division protein ZapE [Pseudomonadota bacterium]
MTTPHPIRQAYERALQHDGHLHDPAQERVVELLCELALKLEADGEPAGGLLARLLRRRRSEAIPGLYIWGGVGRGKTYLMDLFFDSLRVVRKRRIHFHRMMAYVHGRLGRLTGVQDPLASIADDVSQRTRVLCFDEFFVSDIGDAMILGRLLEALFERGVVLIATSNVEPDELYREGLQRARFLPAIDLLRQHTRIVNLDGGTDYRLRLLQKAGTYLDAGEPATHDRLTRFFDDCGSSQVRRREKLDINGRSILATRVAKSVAWFEFAELCDGPRSQADYIELARWYPTVILADVPVFDARREDQARRFISLVDEFYDRRVKLIVSAHAEPEDLYRGKKLEFEFERTSSRLIEMQTEAYLREAHLP